MKSKKGIIIAVVVVAVIGAIVIFGNKLFGGGNKADVGLTVPIEEVKKDTIVTEVSAKGEVSLLNTELIYANTASEVEEVLVEKNDYVHEGDVLLRYKEKSRESIENQLKDAELSLRSAKLSLQQSYIPATQTEVEGAEISVSKAKTDIENLDSTLDSLERAKNEQERKLNDAKKSFEDSQALFDVGAISKSDLEKAEELVKTNENLLKNSQDEYEKAEDSKKTLEDNLRLQEVSLNELKNRTSTDLNKNTAAQKQISIEQIELKVKELRKNLEDFQEEILSPISGTITELNISKGAITPTDRSLMEISNVDDFVVKVDVNERNAAKIALGQDVVIKGPVLGDETVTGKVSKIASIAEVKQSSTGSERVVSVEITVDPSANTDLLKPGFSLEAVITTETKENVVVVPILATLKDGEGNNYVFVVGDGNTLEKRVVKLGLYSDMVVEATGIEEGEKIVSQPSFDMIEGMVITPMGMEEALQESKETEGDK